jgi:predicted permease
MPHFNRTERSRSKIPLRLIRFIGLIVPRRLRADWRQEWEAELRYREMLLADWDKLNWPNKFDLLRRSVGAFWDALRLQPQRLEEEMFQDLRYGLRMLLNAPGFTLVAALSLALGIGANTAIFSLLDAVLLKSLPVREPAGLVFFGKGDSVGMTNSFPNGSWDLFSYSFYKQVREHNEVFTDVAALQSFPNDVHGVVNTAGAGGEAEKLSAQLVSGSYFSVLGVNAGLGRVLTEADDQTPGGHPVVVVSHAWWSHRLGGDPAAIGKTITIDKTAYTIVGVAPREFFGTTVGQAPDLWVPLAMEKQMPPTHWDGRTDKLFQSLFLVARLKPGVRAQQASGAVNLQFKQFLQEIAGANPAPDRLRDLRQATVELTPAGRGFSELRRQFSLSLKILMAVVGAVLLIACANVANLLLARAAVRQKEFAVRLALGAARTRLIRQSLTESALLAGLGGVAGIALAWGGSRLVVLMASGGPDPLPINVAPDARVLGFTLAASLLSAVVFGMAPALRASRIEPNASLKGGKGATKGTTQSSFGKALVVAQVALSLLLLVGAGLFIRTLINLQNVNLGFNQESALLFKIDTSASGVKEGPQFASLMREVETKVETVPGVRAASFSFFIFNQGAWSSRAFTRDRSAAAPPGGGSRVVLNNVVGQEYFTAMDIPITMGRGFTPRDTDASQQVAVISETMAQRFFPNQSPLGERFGISGPDSGGQIEVVGVVKDAKVMSLTEQPRAMAYYPHSQRSDYINNFVVRFTGPQDAIVPQIRRAIHDVNPNLPVDEIVSLSEHVGRSLVQQKLIARLAAFFGLLALLLACVGLYGVLSYSVARRSNEIGIRMALGARRGNVLWLVLRESLGLTAGGVIIGAVAAIFSTKLAASLLFGLKPTDPLTIAGATLLLIAVATLAGFLPARRASRVDPMVALRDE